MVGHARVVVALAAACVVGAGACESSLGLGSGPVGTVDPVATLPAGLSQHVTIAPESPMIGEDFLVRSVLRNDTTEVMQVSSRICGLNWGGGIRVSAAPGGGSCDGFSTTTALAPGDSIVGHATWRILSPPGTYTLYVGHLVTPGYGHPLQVTVQ